MSHIAVTILTDNVIIIQVPGRMQSCHYVIVGRCETVAGHCTQGNWFRGNGLPWVSLAELVCRTLHGKHCYSASAVRRWQLH